MTTNIGFKGINVRQTVNELVLRVLLADQNGNLVTTGTTSLYLYELQADGSLKSYDFSSNTFKTTALTTGTASLTHQTGNNSTVNTGIWTYSLGTLSGFTIGSIYLAEVTNTSASPVWQVREFQFGDQESDSPFAEFTVGSSSTTSVVNTNRTEADNFWNHACIAFMTGTLAGYATKITSYANSSGAFTTANTLPATPSNGDRGIILGVGN